MIGADIEYGLASLWNATVRLLKGVQNDLMTFPERRRAGTSDTPIAGAEANEPLHVDAREWISRRLLSVEGGACQGDLVLVAFGPVDQ